MMNYVNGEKASVVRRENKDTQRRQLEYHNQLLQWTQRADRAVLMIIALLATQCFTYTLVPIAIAFGMVVYYALQGYTLLVKVDELNSRMCTTNHSLDALVINLMDAIELYEQEYDTKKEKLIAEHYEEHGFQTAD